MDRNHRKVCDCFTDQQDPIHFEHPVKASVAQGVFALAPGYEDLNDHDLLQADPLLAVLADKPDPADENLVRDRGHGKALAGKSTRNRS